jgi:hypothetical protein
MKRPSRIKKYKFFPVNLCAYCVLILAVIGMYSFQLVRDIDKEYKLKAAFIYNFIQYIDWSVTSPKEYVIGVIGASPIEEDLREIALTKTANDKKIIVHKFSSSDDLSSCNIIFIPREASGSLETVLSRASKGTLVVSEKPGCGKQGSAINFVIVDNKLKFETNLKALNSAGLKASSQLLKLAIIIGDKNG